MTPDAIRRVNATLDRCDLEALAAAFHRHLFSAHPELREIFPDDVVALRRKFGDELRAIAAAIVDLDGFVTRTRELGQRHAGYGVGHDHYAPVGAALIAAFESELPDVEPADLDAWRRAFTLVAETMMEGASANPFSGVGSS
ncbi:globin domain-containing protein [Nitriliruptor alkaliphilus]|uniref:globin domain-containing protein n=1 Tax=Nitriliruptor alkaliphilus TaxID=427918 RepID=UPI000698FC80|nr:globin domain-containing protein [Nitriliruptor alkaliphilus]